MSTGFQEVFGGQALYPDQPTYILLNISANTSLSWPIEQQIAGPNVVAAILDIQATTPGLSISMPDARAAAQGNAMLLNNIGSQTVTIITATGGSILSLAPATQWYVYLSDNSTLAGVWRSYQLGATTSVANAAALAGAGLEAIGTTLNQTLPIIPTAVNRTFLNSDRAQAVVWNGGVGTLTLPDATVVGSNWFTVAKNLGSGNATLTPQGGQTIDLGSTVVLAPGQSCFIGCDGMNFFTVGLSVSNSSNFDYTAIDVSGAGDFVLAGVQLNRIAYRFTGTITGDRRIVVPNTIQQYWVDNETSGAFALSVAVAAQSPGIIIGSGLRNILYCNGTVVVNADTANTTFPIPIAQGGTGAITASGALANLGALTSSRIINSGSGLVGGGNLTADLTLSVDPAVIPLLSSANTFTAVNSFVRDIPPVIAALATSAGASGVRVTNELVSRELEILYLGSTAASLYGATAGSAVINTPSGTDLYISAGDLNRIQISSTTGLITLKNQVQANGKITINPTTGQQGLTINAIAGQYAAQFNGSASAGVSFGLAIAAGTNSADQTLLVSNQAGGALFTVRGDGQAQFNGVVLHASGTAATPGISFVADTVSGFYRQSANTIGIALGGAEAFTLAGIPTTGASTPTLTANKPGANAGVGKWIPITAGGVTYWIPAFSN